MSTVKSCLLLAGCLLAGCGSQPPSQATVMDAVEQANAAITVFKTRLQARLSEAIAQGGPASAIGVCKDAAPAIADETSRQAELTIGRTALRVRNPQNAPDTWEREILQGFETDLKAGAAPSTLSARRIDETSTGYAVRVMTPIMTGGVCLTCHGDNIPPDVSEEIARLYPEDTATGFQMGELRGAFSLSVPVDGS